MALRESHSARPPLSKLSERDPSRPVDVDRVEHGVDRHVILRAVLSAFSAIHVPRSLRLKKLVVRLIKVKSDIINQSKVWGPSHGSKLKN